MKRSSTDVDDDNGDDAGANKRICNRIDTNVYAYAITSDDPIGWHASYCGYINDVSDCINDIATELTAVVEKIGMKLCKVRWQLRVVNGEGMVTFSSIVIFVDDVSDSLLPSQTISLAIKSCLFDYLSHRVPLYYRHQYVLRDMTISDGVAFVVCPPNVNIGKECKYHNEWFSQPIGELVPWDESNGFRVLRIFECMDGKVNVFRGNDRNDRNACFVMYMGNDNELFRYVGPR